MIVFWLGLATDHRPSYPAWRRRDEKFVSFFCFFIQFSKSSLSFHSADAVVVILPGLTAWSPAIKPSHTREMMSPSRKGEWRDEVFLLHLLLYSLFKVVTIVSRQCAVVSFGWAWLPDHRPSYPAWRRVMKKFFSFFSFLYSLFKCQVLFHINLTLKHLLYAESGRSYFGNRTHRYLHLRWRWRPNSVPWSPAPSCPVR